jgi:predicted lysophospholipase L1 biosynthesis ABC-type transport system permease subunit
MPAKKKAAAGRLQIGSRVEVTSILERVTRAEERVIAIDRVQSEWRDETREAHKGLAERLDTIEASLHKYQGAWGLITIVLSAVGMALAAFGNSIAKKLGFE